jgi:putative ABC transport system permease protein
MFWRIVLSKIVSFMVKRYLRFDREQPFITLSAILAFIGIALGVMVLIVAMAIMNGFDKEFEKKLSIMNYPLTVVSSRGNFVSDEVLNHLQRSFPEFKYSPYLVGSVVAKRGDNMEGGFLFGVDFKQEAEINPVVKDATEGLEFGKFETLVGSRLYYDFVLDSETKLTYIFTVMDPSGLLSTPKMKRFKVKGSFHSGLSSYDSSYHYTTLHSLRKILRVDEGKYHGIHIDTADPVKDIERVKESLPEDVRVVGWWQQNGNFFSALQMEKRALFIVLMLIILIASVNIISSLLMTVMNRRSEIALLLSFGATVKEIKAIFLSLGVVIGVGGITIGWGLGMIGLYILGNFDIISLPADVYGTSQLPLDLSTGDLVSILVGAFVIVILSALYPAIKASRVDILGVLRNE